MTALCSVDIIYIYVYVCKCSMGVSLGNLDGLVVQLAFQLLVVRDLTHSLHEVLLDHVLPLSAVRSKN